MLQPQYENPFHTLIELMLPAKPEPAAAKKPRAKKAYKPADGASLLDAVIAKTERSTKTASRDLKALGNRKTDWYALSLARQIAATHAYKALSAEKIKELGVYLCPCGKIIGRTHPCNENTYPSDGPSDGPFLKVLSGR